MEIKNKQVRDYVARLKWITLREFKELMEKSNLPETKAFSVVYTIEGMMTISKKEKKKIYKATAKSLIANPLAFNMVMGALRQYAIMILPHKLYEEITGVPKNAN